MFSTVPSLLAVLVAAGAIGCSGDIGDTRDSGPPPPPDVEPLDVPASPTLLTTTGSCVELAPGEQLVSVSPEGHAWVVAPDGAATTEGTPAWLLRTIDPFVDMAEVTESVGLTAPLQVQAWSSADASVLAEDGLWLLEDLARIQLTSPAESISMFCGNPGDNGFLLAAGSLFERRLDGQWWGWDPGVSGDAAPTSMLRYDGECQSASDMTWLTSPDGTLWQLSPTEVRRPVQFPSLVDAAATEASIAVLETDRMWMGPDPLQPYVFPNGTPVDVEASAGHYYMVSGSQLLRFDGETWEELTHDAGASPEQIIPHGGGVWVRAGTTLCHQAVGALLRVEGLRPYARSTELDYDVRVQSNDPALSLTAFVDEEAVELTLDAESGWYEGNVRLDTVGWHAVTFSASDAVTRTFHVKRMSDVERSWAEDILPIYEQHCSGSECHVAGGAADRPDLSSYELWQANAEAIRLRVVELGTMPPPANQGPDWGTQQVEIISQWLEGGMLP